MRINRYIAATGYCSRRKADQLIQSGSVQLNGVVITDFIEVDLKRDRVEIDGKQLFLEQKKYYLFYKPLKVVTTLSDPQNRATVAHYFKGEGRLFPVGRLDFMTEGALIMTNDGDFANRLLHPRYEKKKIYRAVLDAPLTADDMKQFQEGIVIDGKRTAPAQIRKERGKNRYCITLREGRNRQIRKMFTHLKKRVIHLKRIAIGDIELGDLKPGEYRLLKDHERECLMRR